MDGYQAIPLKHKYKVKKDPGHKCVSSGNGAKKRPNHKKSTMAEKKLQAERHVQKALVLLPSGKTTLMRYEDVWK